MRAFLPSGSMLSRFERATVYAVDGLRSRDSPEPTPASVQARRLLFHPLYENFYVLLCIGHLVLAQWEQPVSAHASWTSRTCEAVDAAILCFLAADLLVLQLRYYGYSYWKQRGWVRVKGASLLLMALNLIVVASLPNATYYARLLRPLFLLERKATVRKIAGNMAKALPPQ